MKVQHQFSQYLAEFIGTFFLVFFGCGSMILAEVDSSYNGAFVPIIFGGAVSMMIYATGHISGAHFNPAVTFAFWVTKRFPGKRVVGYWVAQFLGAIAASAFHALVWGTEHGFGKTIITISPFAGLLVEVVLSFVLMFVIMSVATDSRAVGELAGIAIGTTVAMCAFVGGPLTRASMNPARSLSPALLAQDFSNLWLYFVAPIVGSLLGALAYQWVRCYKEFEEGHGSC